MYETLHSIYPKNYNNLFSRATNKNRKIIFRNIFNNEINKKRGSSVFLVSQNQLKDDNNTFNFYKTDLVPFPKFPQIKKYKTNAKKLLLSKTKNNKEKNYFSIKYLELIKDIDNQNLLKNYYYLNKNNKNKSLNEDNKKLINIFLENDIEFLKKGVIIYF